MADFTLRDNNLEDNEQSSHALEVLKKDNFFIGNKYKSSITEQKITFLAMMKIQQGDYQVKRDGIYVSLEASTIKSFMNTPRGDFYGNLKQIAKIMMGNMIGVVDDKEKRFEFITLINKAKYEDGIFSLRFPLELKNNLVAVNRNFTNLPRDIVRDMKCVYSFPLYQLLKSRCFYPAYYSGAKNNVFSFTISLAELKLDLGVVNSNESAVSSILVKGNCTDDDYVLAVEKAVEKKYSRWSDFERRCLVPAIEEINAVSDIYVEHELIRSGKGGRAQHIKFIIWLNREKVVSDVLPELESEQAKELNPEEKMLVALQAGTLLAPEKIAYAGTLSICEAAEYDLTVIQNAYEALKASNGKIDNPTGWLIAAIKDNYKASKRSKKSSGKTNNGTRNKFKNFEERDYDYKDLEKRWLSKRK